MEKFNEMESEEKRTAIEKALDAMTTDEYQWGEGTTEYHARSNNLDICICHHDHGDYMKVRNEDEWESDEIEERVEVEGVKFFRRRGDDWQRGECPEYLPPVTDAMRASLNKISKIHH